MKTTETSNVTIPSLLKFVSQIVIQMNDNLGLPWLLMRLRSATFREMPFIRASCSEGIYTHEKQHLRKNIIRPWKAKMFFKITLYLEGNTVLTSTAFINSSSTYFAVSVALKGWYSFIQNLKF